MPPPDSRMFLNNLKTAKEFDLFVDNLSMSNSTNDHIGDTVSIRRPPRVQTDTLGRTTWMGTVEHFDFELVSVVSCDPYDSATRHQDWLDNQH